MSKAPTPEPDDVPLAPAALRLAGAARHGVLLLAAASGLTAIAAALAGRKGYFGFDAWPLFYGVFGAAVALATVLLARGLAGLLRRSSPVDEGDSSAGPGEHADV